MTLRYKAALFLLIGLVLGSPIAGASEITVLSSGAYEHVVSQLARDFEKETGNHVVIISDTNGALVRKVREGQRFDLAILAEAGIRDLTQSGHLAQGSPQPTAKVGIGVCVRSGAPKIKIDTEDAFRAALLQAASVTYIDPKAGGSSGIYMESVFTRLGILDQVRAKAVLKQNGRVADLVAAGTAALGVQQISEILPVKGVTYLGPLPPSLQNFTIYLSAISAAPSQADTARAFQSFLVGSKSVQALKSSGMTRPDL